MIPKICKAKENLVIEKNTKFLFYFCFDSDYVKVKIEPREPSFTSVYSRKRYSLLSEEFHDVALSKFANKQTSAAQIRLFSFICARRLLVLNTKLCN